VKKILIIVLAVILTLSLSFSSVTFAAGGKNEGVLAQEAGRAWMDSLNSLDSTGALTGEPQEWIGAYLTAQQVCYDLKGKPDAYMFTIENDGEVVGYMVVGSSDYGYPVFEASDAPPPAIPSTDEVKSALKRDLALDVASIGRPTRLLYLGFDNLFAVYQAGQQEVAVNVPFDFAIPASNLTAAMPSPEVYKANKKATGEAISKLRESSGYNSLSLPSSGCNCLPMTYYCGCGCCCGPSSGVSIGRYFRDYKFYNLPSDCQMYAALYALMQTRASDCWTTNGNYGSGLIAMLESSGYPFHYVGWVPLDSNYANIVTTIDAGWPTAMSASHWHNALQKDGSGSWPPPGGHFIAIRGYLFPYSANVQYSIICTDSYSHSNSLYLNWNSLTSWPYYPWCCTIEEG
jgi:hypothetical protein